MNAGGIGLGLTICKQIVEQSGGKIEAKSRGLNQGSLFMFSMMMESIANPDNLVPLSKVDRTKSRQQSALSLQDDDLQTHQSCNIDQND